MAADDNPTVEVGRPDLGPLPEAQPKRRRKRRGWLIAIVVIIVLLGIAWIVGEAVARNYAENFVRDKVVSSLKLKAGTPVGVTIGPGSLLAQAITGGIDSVKISVDDYAVKEVSGDLDIAMTEIPLDQNAPLDTLRVTYTIPKSEVAGLTAYVSGAENAEVELLDDALSISSEFQLFGIAIPVGVEVAPLVVDGEVGFETKTISLNNNVISVAELKEGPFAGLADSVLANQTFCVASSLPKALSVNDVDVNPKRIVLSLEGDGVALGSKEFSQMGECK